MSDDGAGAAADGVASAETAVPSVSSTLEERCQGRRVIVILKRVSFDPRADSLNACPLCENGTFPHLDSVSAVNSILCLHYIRSCWVVLQPLKGQQCTQTVSCFT